MDRGLQAPLSMGLSRHEYWSRLPFPPAGDLSEPEAEPPSLVSALKFCSSVVLFGKDERDGRKKHKLGIM